MFVSKLGAIVVGLCFVALAWEYDYRLGGFYGLPALEIEGSWGFFREQDGFVVGIGVYGLFCDVRSCCG